MTPEQCILSGVSLRKQFQIRNSTGSKSHPLTALDGISIELARGETIGIAGESGCGKSTLGKIMAGLLKPDGGEVLYQGKDIKGLAPESYKLFRCKTQMIFQDPFSSLNPRMRVGDIIGEPLLIAGDIPSGLCMAAIEKIMEKVGLTAEHFNRFPHEFSGGQRQRIGIARALAASPEVIIADEPVSSLDISIQAQIINLLQAMKAEYNLSLAIISHDLSVLRHICDRVAIMYLGIIVESAPASRIFSHCLHPYTEALISAIPQINPVPGKTRHILKDDLPSPVAIPSGCRFHPRCRYAEAICSSESPKLMEKLPGHFTACHLSDAISVI